MTTITLPVKEDGDVLTAQNMYDFQALMCKLHLFRTLDRITDSSTVTTDNQSDVYRIAGLYGDINTGSSTAPINRNNDSNKETIDDTAFAYFGNIIDDLSDGTVDTNIWSFSYSGGSGSQSETTQDDSNVIIATFTSSSSGDELTVNMDQTNAIDLLSYSEDVCVIMPIIGSSSGTPDMTIKLELTDGSTTVAQTGDTQVRDYTKHLLGMWYYDHSASTIYFYTRDAEASTTSEWSSRGSASTSALTNGYISVVFRNTSTPAVTHNCIMGVPVYARETAATISQDLVFNTVTTDQSVSAAYSYYAGLGGSSEVSLTRTWTADGSNFNTISSNNTLSTTTNTGTSAALKLSVGDIQLTSTETFCPAVCWNGFIYS